MPPLVLHPTIEEQQVLDADLGVGNRHLLVISGVAIYGWTIDTDETAHGEVELRTGVFARELEQATPFVGLASIANDDTEWVFSIDRATVHLDPDNGEIFMHALTALMGEWSGFNRFGYQIVATVVRVGAFIEGTISWPVSLHRPLSSDTSTVAPSLTVVANQVEMVQATQGSQIWGAAKVEKLTPRFPGVIHSLSVGRSECKAKYRIDNPAMGMPLRVTLTVLTSPSGGVFPAQTYSAQTSWPQVFTLSPANPSETVDFALGTTIAVR